MNAVSVSAVATKAMLAITVFSPVLAQPVDPLLQAPAIQGELGKMHGGDGKLPKGQAVRRRPDITFEWNPKTGQAHFELATGCLATSAANLHDTFVLTVDRHNKKLIVHGDFWYTQRGRHATRDCMKRTSRRLPAGKLNPGSYTIRYEAETLWTLELGAVVERRRLNTW